MSCRIFGKRGSKVSRFSFTAWTKARFRWEGRRI